jgi:hypothetical protein
MCIRYASTLCRIFDWRWPITDMNGADIQAVEVPLKICQTAAVLEVMHSALGIVRSPVAITGVD